MNEPQTEPEGKKRAATKKAGAGKKQKKSHSDSFATAFDQIKSTLSQSQSKKDHDAERLVKACLKQLALEDEILLPHLRDADAASLVTAIDIEGDIALLIARELHDRTPDDPAYPALVEAFRSSMLRRIQRLLDPKNELAKKVEKSAQRELREAIENDSELTEKDPHTFPAPIVLRYRPHNQPRGSRLRDDDRDRQFQRHQDEGYRSSLEYRDDTRRGNRDASERTQAPRYERPDPYEYDRGPYHTHEEWRSSRDDDEDRHVRGDDDYEDYGRLRRRYSAAEDLPPRTERRSSNDDPYRRRRSGQ